MDTGLTVRPVGSAVANGSVRLEPIPLRNAVPTELGPSQSVTATANAAPASNNSVHPAGAAPATVTTNEIVVDPATRELVYRVVNKSSGQVISQVPDPVELQMAAYTRAVQRAINSGKSPTEAAAEADLDIEV